MKNDRTSKAQLKIGVGLVFVKQKDGFKAIYFAVKHNGKVRAKVEVKVK